MEKPFFEVFPQVEMRSDLRDLFEEVDVTKITTTTRKDLIRIYILSHNLIAKEDIYEAEKAIRKSIFGGQNIEVKIYERFVLSSQYNVKTLFETYKDSILEECRHYDHVIFNMLRRAEVSFVDTDFVLFTVEDTLINRSKETDLLMVLDKIFNIRCGMHATVEVAFRESAVRDGGNEDDERIRRNVREIMLRAGLLEMEEKQEEGNGPAGEMMQDGTKDRENHGEQNRDGSVPASVEIKTDTDIPGGSKASGGSRTSGGAKASGGSVAGTTPEKQPNKGRKGADSFNGQRENRRPLKSSENPDVIYGRDVEEAAMEIRDIEGEIGEVVIRGRVESVDTREIRNEKTILMFAVTDFTDTIMVKIFLRNDQVETVLEGVKKGKFLKLRGIAVIDKFDNELGIASVTGIQKIKDFTSMRMDYAQKKRVELHCHTKMSDMDGVTDVAALVKRCAKWGMTAMAITDHGNVQAFPEANHAVEALDDPESFKPIYGVEAYIVDDLKEIVMNCKNQPLMSDYVVFDIETTGFSPLNDKIIEIGAVKVVNGEITDHYSTFVNPERPIPFRIEKLTGINDAMVMEAGTIEEILPDFLAFCRGCILVAHNAGFDVSFIEENCLRQGIPFDYTSVDTVGISRMLQPGLKKHTLDAICKAMGVSLESHHRAVDDAGATAEIFVKYLDMLREENVEMLQDINEKGASSVESIRKMATHHCIILAKNEIGRVNLYTLISESHLTYFSRHPRMPKSRIMAHREGLIIGSACEAGELFKAIVEGRSEKEIARIVNFYDYLEIQPLGNNQFMIASDKFENVNSREDLIRLNKEIVALGEKFHKPVCATCDVHFMDPEDEIYRRIIMTGLGFEDADNQAPLYLRTTEEMLEEFSYLGSDKAQEVVVTNTNLIADMCERISPVRPDKCPPVIPDSDKTLTEICYRKAHEMYGDPLPKIVEDRLSRELNSIISNGFAVMYIIAQKLVWKSVEDGYLVGSRGSVGSSFVATMAGITEVNPLSPHYYCPECHYSDFDSEEVKKYAGNAGCDMPDKMCPNCGAKLKKDGFDIPFETFLGFKGDKEPDIDLNFSGEYQSKAHKYTEVIFGAGQTFRAGTIGTLADKTAFGYVKKYYEEHGMKKRNCEINRIVAGCTGVRRTTGQHPGGIIVLPLGEDINSFTPVQHPANDMETDTVTTHFDYHSIDHNLLKLDILGHDDPTMIRMLEDITGIHATEIPLDDPKVMSLFKNTDALGITPDQIGGCLLGCLGVPEFGTEFAIQMLLDTKPQTFSDLVRIAGLAHGTDVWLGNAQTLIEEGKATISTAICCRDDIMVYLIQMGVEPSDAFSIMENVRKGKVAKKKCDKWPKWREDMLAHGVPEWYCWSCEKIAYMFPKAHAAAYVMMAWRIAYCKINYPLAYYAAYFSIRASGFSYELMCLGEKRLLDNIADYERRMDSLTNKEQDSYKDMKVVREMYARGLEFEPIDIFRANSRLFQVVGDKLMPSLSSIDGLGEKAADAIVEAAKDGPFLSRDDFRDRTKVSKTVVDLLNELGLLGNLPESNQLSLFDF